MDQDNQLNIFEFKSFVIDPNTVRLFKQGQVIKIELLVFETLLLLVSNNERVITKDELMQQIWGGRFVTDHVITRTIYEIRKIIDVDDDNSSMIRTVRGKGYQFIADVKKKAGLKQTEQLVVEHKAKQTGLKKIIPFTFILLSVLGVWYLYQNQQIPETKPHKEIKATYPIVAVLPIRVEGGSEELSMLVQSLVDYLSYQLALNLNMKVIHPDSLLSLGHQQDDVWAIQQATRSDFIIQGFVQSVSDQNVNLHLTLYKKNVDGELLPFPLGAFEFPYPKNAKELNDLYKQRKVTVRSIVEIIEPSMVVNDDGTFETSDPEAYRLVIAAHHMSRTDDCKDMQRAEQLLLKAVERDDAFVYAYLQLFSNYYKRVWICGESTDFHQKGLAMAEIIDRLAPNSYGALAIRRSTILVESNQVEQAYTFSKNADWNNPNALYDQSYSLRYAGFLNVASQNLDRILQLDPLFFSDKPIQQAPNTLLYQNRFEMHLSLLAEPGNSYHDYFRGLNLLLTKQHGQAIVILQGVVDRTPTDLFGQFSQALLYIAEKDYSNAVQTIDAIIQLRHDKKHTDGEMTYKLAQLYALANEPELALKNLQISVDQGFFPMNYFLHDPALKSIQNTEQFMAIVKQATERHLAFAERFGLESEAESG